MIPGQRWAMDTLSPKCANTSLIQARRPIKWYGCSTFAVGLTLPKRTMFAPFNDFMSRPTIPDPDELEHYLQHIPMVGPVYLRISQDPHITRILRVVQPQF
jgi:hypothetical protein